MRIKHVSEFSMSICQKRRRHWTLKELWDLCLNDPLLMDGFMLAHIDNHGFQSSPYKQRLKIFQQVHQTHGGSTLSCTSFERQVKNLSGVLSPASALLITVQQHGKTIAVVMFQRSTTTSHKFIALAGAVAVGTKHLKKRHPTLNQTRQKIPWPDVLGQDRRGEN